MKKDKGSRSLSVKNVSVSSDSKQDVAKKGQLDSGQRTKQVTPDILSKKYKVKCEIGHGAQGKVYHAERLSDHMSVAIKELRIDSLKNWKSYDLFWREAETLKSLNVPGVAKFYDVVESLDGEAPCAYLVQQYISGRSLAEMIRNGYRFDVRSVFQMAVQIVDILEKLHRHEPPIIHRDIKPSNIMIEKAGTGFKVYLIDFGAVANPLLQKGGSTVAGTYGYMPPEQLMGKPVPASDIYALGAMLAGLLSGMEPGEMEIIDYRLAIEIPLKNLPHSVVACLREMVQPKLENRLCDYTQLRTKFEQFAEGQFFNEKVNTFQQALPAKNRTRFYRRLKNVYQLGKSENFELWNDLPESTPRRIPLSYRWFFYPKKPLFGLITSDAYGLYQAHVKSLFRFVSPFYFFYSPVRWVFLIAFQMPLVVLITLLVPLLIPAWAALLYFASTESLKMIINGTENSIIISIFVFGAIVISLFLLGFSIYGRLKRYKNNYNKYKQCVSAQKAYESLLIHGRKTVAKITSIQYIGAQPTLVYDQALVDWPFDWIARRFSSIFEHSSFDPGTAYHVMYGAENPRIRVMYAFNPPDDEFPCDCIHSVIIPADSEKTLKPGDLIPILYLIDKRGKNEKVISAPFPIPVRKPVHIQEMVFNG